MVNLKTSEAIATLVGTIIGAGVLGIPYVVAKVGILPGLFFLILIGLAALVLNLMFTEVILRTRMRHQSAGYAKKYLGGSAHWVELISMFVGSYGALTAYLIGEGKVLSEMFGGDPKMYSIMFFALGAVLLFWGLEIIKVLELWLVLVFIVIIFVIFGISSSYISIDNFMYYDIGVYNVLILYGVILFAFGGAKSIVPMREILKKDKKKLRKAVILGSLIPLVIYIFFAILVVGVTGKETSEVATVGLGDKVGPLMVVFGNLFAFFAMGTSFLTTGIVLKEVFMFDFKLNKIISWFFVIIVPFVILISGVNSFITIMGIAGSLTFGLTGIIIILTFWKAKKNGNRKPEFSMPELKSVGALLIAMFLIGVIYTIFDILN